jgi:hypothetical protein
MIEFLVSWGPLLIMFVFIYIVAYAPIDVGEPILLTVVLLGGVLWASYLFNKWMAATFQGFGEFLVFGGVTFALLCGVVALFAYWSTKSSNSIVPGHLQVFLGAGGVSLTATFAWNVILDSLGNNLAGVVLAIVGWILVLWFTTEAAMAIDDRINPLTYHK